MLAEKKPNQSHVGLPDSIFAGLRLPVAPTNEIIINKQHHYSQLSSAPMLEDEFIESDAITKSNIISTTKSPIITTPTEQKNTFSSQDIKKHFSKLYTTHV